MNFPDTKFLGNVVKIKNEDLPEIDLLIGGSPCQNISNLGNGEGLNGEKSSLFFHYYRLKKEKNPKYFLFENVVGNVEAVYEISKLLNCQPVLINSSLVSGQNRNRFYWTNIKFDLPKEKNILLKHVLDGWPKKHANLLLED